MSEIEVPFASLVLVESRKYAAKAILRDGRQLKGQWGSTMAGLAPGHWDIELEGLDRSGRLLEIKPNEISRLEFQE
jgi:hypothetical protein